MGCNVCYSFFMPKNTDKGKKTRGQMAEAKRLSGQAGRRLAKDAALNPGIGAVFGSTGRKLSVSEELANFRADPRLKKKKG